MKALKILIVMLIFIMSVGAVCAAESISNDAIGDDSKEILQTVQEDIATDDSSDILKTTQNDIYTASDDSFTNLTDEINSTDVVDLTHDYKFNNETDDSSGIVIWKDNFVLNGNGCTIDGNNQSRLFAISGNNITLNDLILINGNYQNCGGMRVGGTLTLNNVTFINNHANKDGGAIGITGGASLICNNCRFIDNYAESGSAIFVVNSEAKLYNSYITSKIFAKGSQICLDSNAEAYIENTTFANITSSYTPAAYIKSSKASIVNSKFIDLKANITAGAIATKEGGELYIENCEFENVTSSKNGGAILADVAGENDVKGKVTIIDTKFKDTYSEFGGAYVQLGGDFVLKNTEFINAHANYNGGAIYLSHTNTEINNCTFDSNGVSIIEGYSTYGGAIYCDKSTLTITESKFFNNVASAGNAIYAYDTSYNIKNSTFENNTNPIYTVFDVESNIDKSNVFVNDDNISTNNTYYATIMIGQGIQLVLLNNTNTTTIPERFDLRDYGWVSSIKDQGWMGACWTFGMTGTLESALLKAANITTDFSENNMQNTMLKYSIYGTPFVEGGANIASAGYLLSWLGAFTQDVDTYDEMGKISPVITTQNDIHVQDVMFTPNTEIPNGTQLKLAIMKYGSIDVSFNGQATYNDVTPYYNPETYAQYAYEFVNPNHEVSIVGWDDTFPKEKFLVTPPGNGAWIVKNSYGTAWGDNGFLYVSYYDKTLMNSKDVSNYATSIIIENAEPYNKNYQYDFMWGMEFKSGNQNVSYMNVFEALDDDLIAAVGTYFDKEGVDYTVEIYVNDELKLTQTGVSPYYGYHTIKLNEYIPIKEGDVFKAVITSNGAPILNFTDVRPHYTQNLSYISFDGEPMKDAYDLGYIVCLKVYTVADSNKTNTTNTFTELERLINASGQYLTLDDDYAFDNGTDNKNGIVIDGNNFVLNGNGHMINGNNLSRIFNITANNVTLSNLILTGGNADKGAAIYASGSLTLNNVTFTDNYASKQGGAVGLYGDVTLNCNNSQFRDNYAEAGSSIFVEKGKLNIYNTDLSSKIFNKYSQIVAFKNSIVYVENVTFMDSSSSYAAALFFKGIKSATIRNSKFINLKANMTAGAIGLRNGGELYIENCEFTNTTSTNNGGAVFVDITGENEDDGNVTLIDSVFRDTYSGFGGAYVQLGGKLLLSNSEFINNHATFNGGAIYLSYTDAEINNCNFTSNGVELNDQDYPTYGGAALFDMSTISINNVNFINNTASAGSAIYAYDASYAIKNSVFENNTNPIYTVFDVESNIDKSNVFVNDDKISTNNTYYATIIATPGLQLTLLNNSINVTALPKRFDLREWGWVSPVKNQGWIGACWTFGMTSALESSLLKATGILSDLSENSMRNLMLRYSVWGSKDLYEGAYNAAAVAYLISWLGAFIEDADQFDEMGKISPYISTLQDVHVQDVMFIPNNEIPNGTQMKWAILKYGALDVGYFGQSTFDQANPYYNPETHAQYVNVSIPSNHEVSVVGWDDNYPKENFLITPPGDGAWIIKNSWGTSWGDNGYLYVSYYDKTFVESTSLTLYATAIIFENTVQYNKNYQYDIAWAGSFLAGEGNRSYLNQYVAQDDDLIAAVGTYFNQADVNYTVEIYVNDELKLTQEGISPFCGYHTIKLDSYIPIKKGDVFKAKISSNTVPYIVIGDERVHYTANISFIAMDGVTWEDAYLSGVIACLKVYTVADDSKIINNKNIAVDYDGGKYFSVNVVTADGIPVAGASVKFNINGKTTTVKTSSNGVAKIKITQTPKKYTIKTTYNGKTVKNTVTVKQVLTASKVTVKKTAKKFTLKAKLKINGKLVKGKIIKFKFNGKTYKAKTNAKGVAQKTLTKKVINKLKKGKTYTVKVTYLKDTIKTTVKVK